MEGTKKLYLKWKKKIKAHRGVLYPYKGELLDIGRAIIPLNCNGVSAIGNNGNRIKAELNVKKLVNKCMCFYVEKIAT